mgnify:CR=1 FL=1
MRKLAASLTSITLLVLAAFAGVSQAQDKVLRIVPHSNLAILDPIWTTAYMSRNHGYMIYDTLFGTDEKNQIKPQMVESWTESPDHRLWTFKLRRGLEFGWCGGDAKRSQPVSHDLDTVGLLDPQLRRSRQRGFPFGVGRGDEQRRKLVDRQRHQPLGNGDALERRVTHPEIGDRFAARRALVEHRNIGPHQPQDVDRAAAGRIHSDFGERDI